MFSLNQNYPNPFNPSTTISFDIIKSSEVVVNIFDINGKLVKSFDQGYLNSGSHSVRWNGKSDLEKQVAGGVYLYTLTYGNETSIIKKMSLIK